MSTASTRTLGRVLWEEDLQGGSHWSGILRRGTTLRLTDVDGGANVSALFYNHEDRLERYNMADTLKAQHTAYLTEGFVCYSDMGRILCSITADTCGWHDTLCGVSNAASVADKYGESRFQERRNDYYKNGYDSLLNELGKYGMGKRDMVANVNFFSEVTIGQEGQTVFRPGGSTAGDFVDLRFEMHALVVLATCPHPLDPEVAYRPRHVRLEASLTGSAPQKDACRDRCPENQRGFRNTEMLYVP
jgi:urea carboxylase-associated protein 2